MTSIMEFTAINIRETYLENIYQNYDEIFQVSGCSSRNLSILKTSSFLIKTSSKICVILEPHHACGYDKKPNLTTSIKAKHISSIFAKETGRSLWKNYHLHSALSLSHLDIQCYSVVNGTTLPFSSSKIR